jgi:hypothetical protein
MDIVLGNFSFSCDKTVAVIIWAIPLIFVMSLPQFARITKAVIRWQDKKIREKKKKVSEYGIG